MRFKITFLKISSYLNLSSEANFRYKKIKSIKTEDTRKK